MYLVSAFLFSVRRALIPSCRAGLWALWMAGVAVMAGWANTSPPAGRKSGHAIRSTALSGALA